MNLFSRGTIIQDCMILTRSFYLKCLRSICFSVFGHGPRIESSHTESWNNFRFEAGVPREDTWKPATWKVVQAFLYLEKIKRSQPLCKRKFLKQATFRTYVLGKLSKFVQVTARTSSDLFLQRILWKLKGVWNTGSRPHFL